MDRETAAQVAIKFRGRLIKWVERRLGHEVGKRLDAASVVDSVLKSLCRLSEAKIPDTEQGLQGLLWVMTRWKHAKRLRRELAGRRDVRQDTPLGASGELSRPDWGPEEEAAWNELERKYDEWKADLLPNRRQVLDLWEQDVPQEEIAKRLTVSDRTVRRWLTEDEDNLRRYLDR